MAVSVFWKTFALSLTTVPFCIFANKFLTYFMKWGFHSVIIAITGILMFGLYIAAIYYTCHASLTRKKIKDPYYYGFALFSLTSVIDLGIGLELDGYISDFLTSYLVSGEPYLSSPYGAVITYFDGLVMYALYLWIIHAISNSKSYRSAGLYWAGTLINSMIILLLGILAGKHGVFPATALNIPYIIFPVMVTWKLLQERPFLKTDVLHQPLFKRPIDLTIIVMLTFTILITFIRGLAVVGDKLWFVKFYVNEIEPVILLDDPCPFNKLQMLSNLFYFVPIQMLAIYALISPGCTWMPDMILFYAGAIFQGQFSHISSAIHSGNPEQFRTSEEMWVRNTFWGVNLLYTLIPHLLLLRCITKPEFFAIQPKQDTNVKSKFR